MGDFFTIVVAVFYLGMGWYCIQKPKELATMVYTFFANAQGNAYDAQNWQPMPAVIWGIRILGALCLFNFAMQIFLVGQEVPPQF